MNNNQQTMRTVHVAAIQVESQPGQIAANHAHALPALNANLLTPHPRYPTEECDSPKCLPFDHLRPKYSM